MSSSISSLGGSGLQGRAGPAGLGAIISTAVPSKLKSTSTSLFAFSFCRDVVDALVLWLAGSGSGFGSGFGSGLSSVAWFVLVLTAFSAIGCGAGGVATSGASSTKRGITYKSNRMINSEGIWHKIWQFALLTWQLKQIQNYQNLDKFMFSLNF